MPVPIQNKDAITPQERALAEAEGQAIVDSTPYKDSPLRAYIVLMDRVKNFKDANGRWSSELSVKPYMEAAGRVVEANTNEARPLIGVQTYLNDGTEPMTEVYRGEAYVTPPHAARAVVVLLVGEREAHFTAMEAIRSSDRGVNSTHSLANAETSALGRALGFAGFGNMPGSSLSPAETMATTPQDDVVDPKAAEKAAKAAEAAAKKAEKDAAKAAAELTFEEIEAINGYVVAIRDTPTVEGLLVIGKQIAADDTLAPKQITYLQTSYKARREELSKPPEAEEGELDTALATAVIVAADAVLRGQAIEDAIAAEEDAA